VCPRRKGQPSCLVHKAAARPQDTKLTERYSFFFCPRHIDGRFRLDPRKKTCPPTSSVLSSWGFCNFSVRQKIDSPAGFDAGDRWFRHIPTGSLWRLVSDENPYGPGFWPAHVDDRASRGRLSWRPHSLLCQWSNSEKVPLYRAANSTPQWLERARRSSTVCGRPYAAARPGLLGTPGLVPFVTASARRTKKDD
jgi:hypothetical protein